MLILKILGVVAYLQFGYHVVGKFSWRVWHRKQSRGILAFLLFPMSSMNGDVGKHDAAMVDQFKSERSYATTLAFLWGLKPFWSVFALAVIGGCLGIGFAFRFMVWLTISAPNAIVCKLTGRPNQQHAASPVSDRRNIYDAITELKVHGDVDRVRRLAQLKDQKNKNPAN